MPPPGRDVRTQTPPDFEKIVASPIRSDRDKLLAYLSWRVFQTKLKPAEQEPFMQFLQNKPAPISDETLRDLLHLMMSTPQYQLT